MNSSKNLYDRIRASVHILLLHPLHPGNVGAVARTMKNMGYKKLILIAQKDPRCSPEAFWMAKGAADVLENASIYTDLDSALAPFSLRIGTTSRQGNRWRKVLTPEKLSDSLTPSWDWKPTALLFGPEDRGLSVKELAQCRWIVRIPTHSDYPSMNLSHAVTILCYILLHRPLSWSGKNGNSPPSPEELRQFLGETEQFLENVAFLKDNVQSDRARRILLENLLLRSAPDQSELRTLWSLLRHLKK